MKRRPIATVRVTALPHLANGGDVLDVTSYLSWRDVVRKARRAER